MNKSKQPTDGNKELSTYFKFFLFVQVVVGIVFLLNGPIKSNFGYKPVEAVLTGEAETGGGGPGTVKIKPPKVIDPKNREALKKSWPLPQIPQTQQAFIDGLEKEILAQTNLRRADKNLPALTWEDHLAGTARYHSGDMGTRQFFSHINPDNVGPFFRISKLHRRFIGGGGENIMKISKDSGDTGTMAKKIVTHWMNSTGHRQNILSKDYSALGVGVVETPGQNNIPMLYVTQLFGKAAGYLQQDFPQQIQAGQEHTITVQCVNNGYTAPLSGEVVEVNTRQAYPFQLTVTPNSGGMTASGKIKAPFKAGVYQLVFQFPMKQTPGTLAIFPGPIFVIP